MSNIANATEKHFTSNKQAQVSTTLYAGQKDHYPISQIKWFIYEYKFDTHYQGCSFLSN